MTYGKEVSSIEELTCDLVDRTRRRPEGLPSDDELIRRLFNTMRVSKTNRGEKRWIKISHLFALGSTTSIALCKFHGMDPDQLVRC